MLSYRQFLFKSNQISTFYKHVCVSDFKNRSVDNYKAVEVSNILTPFLAKFYAYSAM
jgi:hypothetical protein